MVNTCDDHPWRGEVQTSVFEVDEEVIVPGIIRGDVEEVFIGEVCIDG
jgi:hypothetical protein